MKSIRQKLMRAASDISGSTLIGVVALSIILSITAIGLIMVVTSSSRNETIALNDTRAFLAAESGLLFGAEWINDSTNWWGVVEPLDSHVTIPNVIPDLNINNFDVQVDIVTTFAGVIINSKAQSLDKIGYYKIVSQDADPDLWGADPDSFSNAILCDQWFGFKGCGQIINDDGSGAPIKLHSNDTITLNGTVGVNNVIISSSYWMNSNGLGDGDIIGLGLAPGSTFNGCTDPFSGGFTPGAVPELPIPDIDLMPWFYKALANGEVHNGFNTTTDYTPNGGVMWVNGDATLGAQSDFYGTIIATGNVELKGGADLFGPEDGITVASIWGNIKHGSTGIIEKSLVYAKNGDYIHSGNGSLYGQIITKGGIKITGTPTAITFNKTTILHPDPPDVKGCLLVMGTWWEKNTTP